MNLPFPEGSRPDGTADYQRRRTERILERAWAAQRLGQVGRKSPQLVRLLERVVEERSLHRDWMYHGLDGAMAIRALGMLKSAESVPVLIASFHRADPALRQVANTNYSQFPLAWTDFRTKMEILPTLGELRGEASKRFLLDYLMLDESRARELAPPQFEAAAKALLRHKLSSSELEHLLNSPHSAVRGTAILEFLDHSTRARTKALKAMTPWALDLPRSKP